VLDWLSEQYESALADLLSAQRTEDLHFYRGQVVKLAELTHMLSFVKEEDHE
jgi:hypothetical protein